MYRLLRHKKIDAENKKIFWKIRKVSLFPDKSVGRRINLDANLDYESYWGFMRPNESSMSPIKVYEVHEGLWVPYGVGSPKKGLLAPWRYYVGLMGPMRVYEPKEVL